MCTIEITLSNKQVDEDELNDIFSENQYPTTMNVNGFKEGSFLGNPIYS